MDGSLLGNETRGADGVCLCVCLREGQGGACREMDKTRPLFGMKHLNTHSAFVFWRENFAEDIAVIRGGKRKAFKFNLVFKGRCSLSL